MKRTFIFLLFTFMVFYNISCYKKCSEVAYPTFQFNLLSKNDSSNLLLGSTKKYDAQQAISFRLASTNYNDTISYNGNFFSKERGYYNTDSFFVFKVNDFRGVQKITLYFNTVQRDSAELKLISTSTTNNDIYTIVSEVKFNGMFVNNDNLVYQFYR